MKRCPQCNRIETDDALAYCRVDGALLETDNDESSNTLVLPSAPTSDARPTQVLESETAQAKGSSSPVEVPKGALTSSFNLASDSKGRRHKIVIALAILILSACGLAFWFLKYRSSSVANANLAQIESIAVMPFVNESGNPDMEYLSDGMTETLISNLSQIPNLNVKARSSVFRYKGRETDAQTIGRELNVQAVLSGRVVQRGEQLTLYLELVDAHSGNQIWGEQYSRKTTNLVELQGEIARDVSGKLRTRLSGADVQKLAKNYTNDPEAYRLYLQGRFFWNKRSPKEIGKAINYFRQAIDTDPNYALAYAGLADALALPSDIVPQHERAQRSRQAALRALALDDRLAEAHTALAHILLRYDMDFTGAERALVRALELNPNWADTYQRYGELLTTLGRHEEALAKFQQGLEVEPFCLPCRSAYGSALIAARRYDEAIAQLQQVLEMDPNFIFASNGLAIAYQLKGMHRESVEMRAKIYEMRGDNQAAARVREGFASGGWTGYLRAEQSLHTTGERSIDKFSYYQEAVILAALSENDKAFAALYRSHEAGEHPSLVRLKVDPRLDALRGDSRYQDLLRKVGFPP